MPRPIAQVSTHLSQPGPGKFGIMQRGFSCSNAHAQARHAPRRSARRFCARLRRGADVVAPARRGAPELGSQCEPNMIR